MIVSMTSARRGRRGAVEAAQRVGSDHAVLRQVGALLERLDGVDERIVVARSVVAGDLRRWRRSGTRASSMPGRSDWPVRNRATTFFFPVLPRNSASLALSARYCGMRRG